MTDDQAPAATPLRAIPPWQRWLASAAGLGCLCAGAVAVFETANGVGSTGLLVVGALFLLLGLVGLVPDRLKVGDAEVSWTRVADALRSTPVARAASAGDALSGLEARYDALRVSLPPGGQRTALLEGILLQARSLASAVTAADVTQRLAGFAGAGDGARIVTLALLETGAFPVRDQVAALVAAIQQPRSSFEQYHALRAGQTVLPHLAEPDRATVRAAAATFLGQPGADPASDRAKLAAVLSTG
jgi:hypothetical protein